MVNGIGALVEVFAHLTEFTVEEGSRNIAQDADRAHTDKAELLISLFAYAGDLGGGERGEEFPFFPERDLEHAIGLGFVGAYFGDQLID